MTTDVRFPPLASDLSRTAIMELAQKTLDRHPAGSMVHFKFTCGWCGERCTLSEPNMLREAGECFRCGHETRIEAAGFLLVAKLGAR